MPDKTSVRPTHIALDYASLHGESASDWPISINADVEKEILTIRYVSGNVSTEPLSEKRWNELASEMRARYA